MVIKTTSLKHLIFGIISSIIFCSCTESTDSNDIAIYTFSNESEYSISIGKWRNGSVEKFELPVGNSIVQEINLGFGNSSDLISDADSLHIVFNNNKILVLNDKINDFRTINILRLDNYEKARDMNKYYYNYTFSKIDYENAKDCNGSCD